MQSLGKKCRNQVKNDELEPKLPNLSRNCRAYAELKQKRLSSSQMSQTKVKKLN